MKIRKCYIFPKYKILKPDKVHNNKLFFTKILYFKHFLLNTALNKSRGLKVQNSLSPKGLIKRVGPWKMYNLHPLNQMNKNCTSFFSPTRRWKVQNHLLISTLFARRFNLIQLCRKKLKPFVIWLKN